MCTVQLSVSLTQQSVYNVHVDQFVDFEYLEIMEKHGDKCKKEHLFNTYLSVWRLLPNLHREQLSLIFKLGAK